MVRIKPNVAFSLEVETDISGFGKSLASFLDGIEDYEVLVGIPADAKKRKGRGIKNNAELALILSEGRVSQDVRSISDALEKNYSLSRKRSRELAQQLYIEAKGSPGWHAPPRSLIEPMIEKYSDEISEVLQEAVTEFIQGDISKGEERLDAAGQLATGYAQRFEEYDWPPNAESTIRRKGSSQPNLDTGQLRAAITYIVEKDGNEI